MDEDEKVLSDLETQLDNIFMVLSSNNSNDSDILESQHGLNDKHMSSLLDACRQMDSWFIKKRLALSTYCQEYALKEEIDALNAECTRKEKLVQEVKSRIEDYSKSLQIIIDQVLLLCYYSFFSSQKTFHISHNWLKYFVSLVDSPFYGIRSFFPVLFTRKSFKIHLRCSFTVSGPCDQLQHIVVIVIMLNR
ncbi:Mediator complex subunit 28 [Schistosoma japonicum]|nr:Mediator complex subunit 28 [Schistosoma japonicum]